MNLGLSDHPQELDNYIFSHFQTYYPANDLPTIPEYETLFTALDIQDYNLFFSQISSLLKIGNLPHEITHTIPYNSAFSNENDCIVINDDLRYIQYHILQSLYRYVSPTYHTTILLYSIALYDFYAVHHLLLHFQPILPPHHTVPIQFQPSLSPHVTPTIKYTTSGYNNQLSVESPSGTSYKAGICGIHHHDPTTISLIPHPIIFLCDLPTPSSISSRMLSTIYPSKYNNTSTSIFPNFNIYYDYYAQHTHIIMLKLLINHNIDINQIDPITMKSPLYFMLSDKTTIKKNHKGFMYANHHLEMISLLLLHNAKCYTLSPSGQKLARKMYKVSTFDVAARFTEATTRLREFEKTQVNLPNLKQLLNTASIEDFKPTLNVIKETSTTSTRLHLQSDPNNSMINTFPFFQCLNDSYPTSTTSPILPDPNYPQSKHSESIHSTDLSNELLLLTQYTRSLSINDYSIDQLSIVNTMNQPSTKKFDPSVGSAHNISPIHHGTRSPQSAHHISVPPHPLGTTQLGNSHTFPHPMRCIGSDSDLQQPFNPEHCSIVLEMDNLGPPSLPHETSSHANADDFCPDFFHFTAENQKLYKHSYDPDDYRQCMSANTPCPNKHQSSIGIENIDENDAYFREVSDIIPIPTDLYFNSIASDDDTKNRQQTNLIPASSLDVDNQSSGDSSREFIPHFFELHHNFSAQQHEPILNKRDSSKQHSFFDFLTLIDQYQLDTMPENSHLSPQKYVFNYHYYKKHHFSQFSVESDEKSKKKQKSPSSIDDTPPYHLSTTNTALVWLYHQYTEAKELFLMTNPSKKSKKGKHDALSPLISKPTIIHDSTNLLLYSQLMICQRAPILLQIRDKKGKKVELTPQKTLKMLKLYLKYQCEMYRDLIPIPVDPLMTIVSNTNSHHNDVTRGNLHPDKPHQQSVADDLPSQFFINDFDPSISSLTHTNQSQINQPYVIIYYLVYTSIFLNFSTYYEYISLHNGSLNPQHLAPPFYDILLNALYPSLTFMATQYIDYLEHTQKEQSQQTKVVSLDGHPNSAKKLKAKTPILWNETNRNTIKTNLMTYFMYYMRYILTYYSHVILSTHLHRNIKSFTTFQLCYNSRTAVSPLTLPGLSPPPHQRKVEQPQVGTSNFMSSDSGYHHMNFLIQSHHKLIYNYYSNHHQHNPPNLLPHHFSQNHPPSSNNTSTSPPRKTLTTSDTPHLGQTTFFSPSITPHMSSGGHFCGGNYHQVVTPPSFRTHIDDRTHSRQSFFQESTGSHLSVESPSGPHVPSYIPHSQSQSVSRFLQRQTTQTNAQNTSNTDSSRFPFLSGVSSLNNHVKRDRPSEHLFPSHSLSNSIISPSATDLLDHTPQFGSVRPHLLVPHFSLEQMYMNYSNSTASASSNVVAIPQFASPSRLLSPEGMSQPPHSTYNHVPSPRGGPTRSIQNNNLHTFSQQLSSSLSCVATIIQSSSSQQVENATCPKIQPPKLQPPPYTITPIILSTLSDNENKRDKCLGILHKQHILFVPHFLFHRLLFPTHASQFLEDNQPQLCENETTNKLSLKIPVLPITHNITPQTLLDQSTHSYYHKFFTTAHRDRRAPNMPGKLPIKPTLQINTLLSPSHLSPVNQFLSVTQFAPFSKLGSTPTHTIINQQTPNPKTYFSSFLSQSYNIDNYFHTVLSYDTLFTSLFAVHTKPLPHVNAIRLLQLTSHATFHLPSPVFYIPKFSFSMRYIEDVVSPQDNFFVYDMTSFSPNHPHLLSHLQDKSNFSKKAGMASVDHSTDPIITNSAKNLNSSRQEYSDNILNFNLLATENSLTSSDSQFNTDNKISKRSKQQSPEQSNNALSSITSMNFSYYQHTHQPRTQLDMYGFPLGLHVLINILLNQNSYNINTYQLIELLFENPHFSSQFYHHSNNATFLYRFNLPTSKPSPISSQQSVHKFNASIIGSPTFKGDEGQQQVHLTVNNLICQSLDMSSPLPSSTFLKEDNSTIGRFLQKLKLNNANSSKSSSFTPQHTTSLYPLGLEANSAYSPNQRRYLGGSRFSGSKHRIASNNISHSKLSKNSIHLRKEPNNIDKTTKNAKNLAGNVEALFCFNSPQMLAPHPQTTTALSFDEILHFMSTDWFCLTVRAMLRPLTISKPPSFNDCSQLLDHQYDNQSDELFYKNNAVYAKLRNKHYVDAQNEAQFTQHKTYLKRLHHFIYNLLTFYHINPIESPPSSGHLESVLPSPATISSQVPAWITEMAVFLNNHDNFFSIDQLHRLSHNNTYPHQSSDGSTIPIISDPHTIYSDAQVENQSFKPREITPIFINILELLIYHANIDQPTKQPFQSSQSAKNIKLPQNMKEVPSKNNQESTILQPNRDHHAQSLHNPRDITDTRLNTHRFNLISPLELSSLRYMCVFIMVIRNKWISPPLLFYLIERGIFDYVRNHNIIYHVLPSLLQYLPYNTVLLVEIMKILEHSSFFKFFLSINPIIPSPLLGYKYHGIHNDIHRLAIIPDDSIQTHTETRNWILGLQNTETLSMSHESHGTSHKHLIQPASTMLRKNHPTEMNNEIYCSHIPPFVDGKENNNHDLSSKVPNTIVDTVQIPNRTKKWVQYNIDSDQYQIEYYHLLGAPIPPCPTQHTSIGEGAQGRLSQDSFTESVTMSEIIPPPPLPSSKFKFTPFRVTTSMISTIPISYPEHLPSVPHFALQTGISTAPFIPTQLNLEKINDFPLNHPGFSQFGEQRDVLSGSKLENIYCFPNLTSTISMFNYIIDFTSFLLHFNSYSTMAPFHIILNSIFYQLSSDNSQYNVRRHIGKLTSSLNIAVISTRKMDLSSTAVTPYIRQSQLHNSAITAQNNTLDTNLNMNSCDGSVPHINDMISQYEVLNNISTPIIDNIPRKTTYAIVQASKIMVKHFVDVTRVLYGINSNMLDAFLFNSGSHLNIIRSIQYHPFLISPIKTQTHLFTPYFPAQFIYVSTSMYDYHYFHQLSSSKRSSLLDKTDRVELSQNPTIASPMTQFYRSFYTTGFHQPSATKHSYSPASQPYNHWKGNAKSSRTLEQSTFHNTSTKLSREDILNQYQYSQYTVTHSTPSVSYCLSSHYGDQFYLLLTKQLGITVTPGYLALIITQPYFLDTCRHIDCLVELYNRAYPVLLQQRIPFILRKINYYKHIEHVMRQLEASKPRSSLSLVNASSKQFVDTAVHFQLVSSFPLCSPFQKHCAEAPYHSNLLSKFNTFVSSISDIPRTICTIREFVQNEIASLFNISLFASNTLFRYTYILLIITTYHLHYQIPVLSPQFLTTLPSTQFTDIIYRIIQGGWEPSEKTETKHVPALILPPLDSRVHDLYAHAYYHQILDPMVYRFSCLNNEKEKPLHTIPKKNIHQKYQFLAQCFNTNQTHLQSFDPDIISFSPYTFLSPYNPLKHEFPDENYSFKGLVTGSQELRAHCNNFSSSSNEHLFKRESPLDFTTILPPRHQQLIPDLLNMKNIPFNIHLCLQPTNSRSLNTASVPQGPIQPQNINKASLAPFANLSHPQMPVSTLYSKDYPAFFIQQQLFSLQQNPQSLQNSFDASFITKRYPKSSIIDEIFSRHFKLSLPCYTYELNGLTLHSGSNCSIDNVLHPYVDIVGELSRFSPVINNLLFAFISPFFAKFVLSLNIRYNFNLSSVVEIPGVFGIHVQNLSNTSIRLLRGSPPIYRPSHLMSSVVVDSIPCRDFCTATNMLDPLSKSSQYYDRDGDTFFPFHVIPPQNCCQNNINRTLQSHRIPSIDSKTSDTPITQFNSPELLPAQLFSQHPFSAILYVIFKQIERVFTLHSSTLDPSTPISFELVGIPEPTQVLYQTPYSHHHFHHPRDDIQHMLALDDDSLEVYLRPNSKSTGKTVKPFTTRTNTPTVQAHEVISARDLYSAYAVDSDSNGSHQESNYIPSTHQNECKPIEFDPNDRFEHDPQKLHNTLTYWRHIFHAFVHKFTKFQTFPHPNTQHDVKSNTNNLSSINTWSHFNMIAVHLMSENRGTPYLQLQQHKDQYFPYSTPNYKNTMSSYQLAKKQFSQIKIPEVSLPAHANIEFHSNIITGDLPSSPSQLYPLDLEHLYINPLLDERYTIRSNSAKVSIYFKPLSHLLYHYHPTHHNLISFGMGYNGIVFPYTLLKRRVGRNVDKSLLIQHLWLHKYQQFHQEIILFNNIQSNVQQSEVLVFYFLNLLQVFKAPLVIPPSNVFEEVNGQTNLSLVNRLQCTGKDNDIGLNTGDKKRNNDEGQIDCIPTRAILNDYSESFFSHPNPIIIAHQGANALRTDHEPKKWTGYQTGDLISSETHQTRANLSQHNHTLNSPLGSNFDGDQYHLTKSHSHISSHSDVSAAVHTNCYLDNDKNSTEQKTVNINELLLIQNASDSTSTHLQLMSIASLNPFQCVHIHYSMILREKFLNFHCITNTTNEYSLYIFDYLTRNIPAVQTLHYKQLLYNIKSQSVYNLSLSMYNVHSLLSNYATFNRFSYLIFKFLWYSECEPLQCTPLFNHNSSQRNTTFHKNQQHYIRRYSPLDMYNPVIDHNFSSYWETYHSTMTTTTRYSSSQLFPTIALPPAFNAKDIDTAMSIYHSHPFGCQESLSTPSGQCNRATIADDLNNLSIGQTSFNNYSFAPNDFPINLADSISTNSSDLNTQRFFQSNILLSIINSIAPEYISAEHHNPHDAQFLTALRQARSFCVTTSPSNSYPFLPSVDSFIARCPQIFSLPRPYKFSDSNCSGPFILTPQSPSVHLMKQLDNLIPHHPESPDNANIVVHQPRPFKSLSSLIFPDENEIEHQNDWSDDQHEHLYPQRSSIWFTQALPLTNAAYLDYLNIQHRSMTTGPNTNAGTVRNKHSESTIAFTSNCHPLDNIPSTKLPWLVTYQDIFVPLVDPLGALKTLFSYTDSKFLKKPSDTLLAKDYAGAACHRSQTLETPNAVPSFLHYSKYPPESVHTLPSNLQSSRLFPHNSVHSSIRTPFTTIPNRNNPYCSDGAFSGSGFGGNVANDWYEGDLEILAPDDTSLPKNLSYSALMEITLGMTDLAIDFRLKSLHEIFPQLMGICLKLRKQIECESRLSGRNNGIIRGALQSFIKEKLYKRYFLNVQSAFLQYDSDLYSSHHEQKSFLKDMPRQVSYTPQSLHTHPHFNHHITPKIYNNPLIYRPINPHIGPSIKHQVFRYHYARHNIYFVLITFFILRHIHIPTYISREFNSLPLLPQIILNKRRENDSGASNQTANTTSVMVCDQFNLLFTSFPHQFSEKQFKKSSAGQQYPPNATSNVTVGPNQTSHQFDSNIISLYTIFSLHQLHTLQTLTPQQIIQQFFRSLAPSQQQESFLLFEVLISFFSTYCHYKAKYIQQRIEYEHFYIQHHPSGELPQWYEKTTTVLQTTPHLNSKLDVLKLCQHVRLSELVQIWDELTPVTSLSIITQALGHGLDFSDVPISCHDIQTVFIAPYIDTLSDLQNKHTSYTLVTPYLFSNGLTSYFPTLFASHSKKGTLKKKVGTSILSNYHSTVLFHLENNCINDIDDSFILNNQYSSSNAKYANLSQAFLQHSYRNYTTQLHKLNQAMKQHQTLLGRQKKQRQQTNNRNTPKSSPLQKTDPSQDPEPPFVCTDTTLTVTVNAIHAYHQQQQFKRQPSSTFVVQKEQKPRLKPDIKYISHQNPPKIQLNHPNLTGIQANKAPHSDENYYSTKHLKSLSANPYSLYQQKKFSKTSLYDTYYTYFSSKTNNLIISILYSLLHQHIPIHISHYTLISTILSLRPLIYIPHDSPVNSLSKHYNIDVHRHFPQQVGVTAFYNVLKMLEKNFTKQLQSYQPILPYINYVTKDLPSHATNIHYITNDANIQCNFPASEDFTLKSAATQSEINTPIHQTFDITKDNYLPSQYPHHQIFTSNKHRIDPFSEVSNHILSHSPSETNQVLFEFAPPPTFHNASVSPYSLPNVKNDPNFEPSSRWSHEVIVARIFELLYGYLNFLEYPVISPTTAKKYTSWSSKIDVKTVINSSLHGDVMFAILSHPNSNIRQFLTSNLPHGVNLSSPIAATQQQHQKQPYRQQQDHLVPPITPTWKLSQPEITVDALSKGICGSEANVEDIIYHDYYFKYIYELSPMEFCHVFDVFNRLSQKGCSSQNSQEHSNESTLLFKNHNNMSSYPYDTASTQHFSWSFMNTIMNTDYLFKNQHISIFVPHPQHHQLLSHLQQCPKQTEDRQIPCDINVNNLEPSMDISPISSDPLKPITQNILTEPQMFIYKKLYQTTLYQDQTCSILWYIVNNIPNPHHTDLAGIISRLTPNILNLYHTQTPHEMTINQHIISVLCSTNHLHQNIFAHIFLRRWNEASIFLILNLLYSCTIPFNLLSELGVFVKQSNISERETNQADFIPNSVTYPITVNGLFWLFAHIDVYGNNIIDYLQQTHIYHYSPRVYWYMMQQYEIFKHICSQSNINLFTKKDVDLLNPYQPTKFSPSILTGDANKHPYHQADLSDFHLSNCSDFKKDYNGSKSLPLGSDQANPPENRNNTVFEVQPLNSTPNIVLTRTHSFMASNEPTLQPTPTTSCNPLIEFPKLMKLRESPSGCSMNDKQKAFSHPSNVHSVDIRHIVNNTPSVSEFIKIQQANELNAKRNCQQKSQLLDKIAHYNWNSRSISSHMSTMTTFPPFIMRSCLLKDLFDKNCENQ